MLWVTRKRGRGQPIQEAQNNQTTQSKVTNSNVEIKGVDEIEIGDMINLIFNIISVRSLATTRMLL